MLIRRLAADLKAPIIVDRVPDFGFCRPGGRSEEVARRATLHPGFFLLGCAYFARFLLFWFFVRVADPEEAVDMVGHHDESVQRDLVSEFGGSLPFFSDDLAIVAEVHPSSLDGAEVRDSLPGICRYEVCPAAVVVAVKTARAGAGRRIDEAFHERRGVGSTEVLRGRHLEWSIPNVTVLPAMFPCGMTVARGVCA